MAELDRRAHLAPFDQVGVRLEDRINLFQLSFEDDIDELNRRLAPPLNHHGFLLDRHEQRNLLIDAATISSLFQRGSS